MPLIRISYSPDLSQIGSVREVSAEEAAALIADSRAVLVDDPGTLTEKSKAELLAQAEQLGVDVSERDSKDTIAQAIIAAESGQA
jgi:hypothetical protein